MLRSPFQSKMNCKPKIYWGKNWLGLSQFLLELHSSEVDHEPHDKFFDESAILPLKFNSSSLKIDGWKTVFFFWEPVTFC